MPRGIPGWRFGVRWGCYALDKELNREEVEKKTTDLLAKVTKGERWVDPRGVTHIPLLLNGAIVGNLWKDVDLNKLEVGAYWAARFGIKVELAYNKEIVGMLWLAQ